MKTADCPRIELVFCANQARIGCAGVFSFAEVMDNDNKERNAGNETGSGQCAFCYANRETFDGQMQMGMEYSSSWSRTGPDCMSMKTGKCARSGRFREDR